MGKNSFTIVKTAPAATEEPLKKVSKRDAEDNDIDLKLNPKKKQKNEKKVPKKKQLEVVKEAKAENCSSAEDESCSDEEPTPPKKQPTVAAKEITSGESKTIFAGNLPFTIEKSDLENFFKEAGEVVDVRFTTNDDGTCKGFAHVKFSSVKSAQKALKLNGRQLQGRKVRLNNAKEKRNASNEQSNDVKGQGSESKTVYVRGIDSSISKHEANNALRNLFSPCGEITRISLPTDQETGVIKGIAFIDLKDGYYKALELSGSDIGGRRIMVSEGKPRGGGGGGDSGGNTTGRSSNTGRFNKGGRSSDNGGRFNKRGRQDSGMPSKPSITASFQGKKTILCDDE